MTTTTKQTTKIKRTILASTAIVAAMAVAWYAFLWKPAGHDLSKARAATAVAQARVSSLQAQSNALQVIERELPADQIQLQRLQAAVPASVALDTALQQINDVATAAGVAVSSVTPSSASGATGAASAGGATAVAGAPGAATPGVASLGLSITFTGTQPQVLAMMSGLASMPRLLVIDHVSFSGAPQVATQVTARMFYAPGQGA